MNRKLNLFLQVVIALIGIGVLAFMLWEPHIEGRNLNATLFQIYFNDPFLAYAYIASIPFFVALYQAFKVLGYAAQNKFFSQPTMKALRTIKHCGVALIGFVAGGEIFIMLGNGDERPPAIFMGLLIIIGSGLMNIIATRVERNLQNSLEKNPRTT